MIKEELVMRLAVWINLGFGSFMALAYAMSSDSPSQAYYSFCINGRIHGNQVQI